MKDHAAPNVTLRALEPEDLDLVYAIENDQSLWPWGCNSTPLSRYTIRQYLQEQQADIYKDGQLRLAVVADGQTVGLADLCCFEPRHRRAEVGIVLCASHQRRGIATQALRLLQRYAHEQLRLTTLYAYVSERNLPGLALFRHLGYTEAARLPHWIDGEQTAMLFLWQKVDE